MPRILRLLLVITSLVGVGLLFLTLPVRADRPAQGRTFPTPTSPTILRVLCDIKGKSALTNQLVQAESAAPCTAGSAAGYPCENIDLVSLVPSATLSPPGTPTELLNGNDIWGWVHPLTRVEYALVGVEMGVAFVSLADPANPDVVGFMPTAAPESERTTWRGLKVYDNHAFIVSERVPHGMQVVDLMQLPQVVQVAHYDYFDSAHNIVINEATGYAYAVGTLFGEENCDWGMHMIDIRIPSQPRFAGCVNFNELGDNYPYVHDAQCVTYPAGSAYAGREICFASKGGVPQMAIVDVSDKSNPQLLASMPYSDSAYAHQTWLTEDMRYLLMDDEFDETDFSAPTRTHLWNVEDLNNPLYLGVYTHTGSTAVDHNLFIRGDFAYAANYRAGLRVLDVSTIGGITETGYFDIYPADDAPEFNGAWGSYVYLPSGNILVSGMEQGMFVLDPTDAAAPDFDAEIRETRATICPAGRSTVTIDTSALYGYSGALSLEINGLPSGASVSFDSPTPAAGSSSRATITVPAGTAPATYYPTLVAGNGNATRQETFALIVSYCTYLPTVAP